MKEVKQEINPNSAAESVKVLILFLETGVMFSTENEAGYPLAQIPQTTGAATSDSFSAVATQFQLESGQKLVRKTE